MTPDEIISEREKTHGSFEINSRVAQAIRYAIRHAAGWTRLSSSQREALDHIAGKIGRIVSGGNHCPDHFADIGGYARLGELETIRRQSHEQAQERAQTVATRGDHVTNDRALAADESAYRQWHALSATRRNAGRNKDSNKADQAAVGCTEARQPADVRGNTNVCSEGPVMTSKMLADNVVNSLFEHIPPLAALQGWGRDEIKEKCRNLIASEAERFAEYNTEPDRE